MALREDREGPLLELLCRLLQIDEGVPVKVTSRPDRDRRDGGGTDAIMVRGKRLMAVEHTRFHSRDQKPRIIRTLELIRPVVAAAVEPHFPRSVVQLGVPVEEMHPEDRWMAMAEDIGRLAVDGLQAKRPHERVVFEVGGLQSRCFAEVVSHHSKRGLCVVSPVVWGREPDDYMVDDICRAIEAKRTKHADRCAADGLPLILLLETTEHWWIYGAADLVVQAAERVGLDGFHEVYVACSAFDPAFLLPVKRGDHFPVGQPEWARFVDHRGAIERLEREKLGLKSSW